MPSYLHLPMDVSDAQETTMEQGFPSKGRKEEKPQGAGLYPSSQGRRYNKGEALHTAHNGGETRVEHDILLTMGRNQDWAHHIAHY